MQGMIRESMLNMDEASHGMASGTDVVQAMVSSSSAGQEAFSDGSMLLTDVTILAPNTTKPAEQSATQGRMHLPQSALPTQAVPPRRTRTRRRIRIRTRKRTEGCLTKHRPSTRSEGA